MNKAKLILSAVAVFAVIGGAFAFKASRVEFSYFTKISPQATVCTVPVNGFLSTTLVTILPTTLYTSTNCATKTFRITEQE